MSELSERVAREHEWTPLDRCTCGEWAPRKGVGPRDFIEHIAAVTEAAVREAIAADILALLDYDRDRFIMLETVEAAYRDAARIARGET